MKRIFEITDTQLNGRNQNYIHRCACSLERIRIFILLIIFINVYLVQQRLSQLFITSSHPALAIHPMPSANKMGSNISNKSVKKSGRIGQNSIKVQTKIKIDDRNGMNKKNTTKRVSVNQSKKKSHSNEVQYRTPNKAINESKLNEEKLYSTQKISKKLIKNKAKSVKEVKSKKNVVNFSAVLDVNEPTKKKVTFNDSIIKQYLSNQPSRQIMNKNGVPIYEAGMESAHNIPQLKETQSERLDKLREYLVSDTERMSKIKKQSDEHAIEQLKVSQKNLFKNIQQLNSQNEWIKKQGERLMKDTKDRYEKQIQLNNRQILKLKDQLTQEREANKRVEQKLKQSGIKMTNMKEQFQIKQKQCQVLNTTIQKLRKQRNSFELQLKKCMREKEIIKDQVKQVLGVVRQEIYNNMESV